MINRTLIAVVALASVVACKSEPGNEANAAQAGSKASGGEAGKVIDGELSKSTLDRLVASADTFRRTLAKAISSTDFWPIFLLIGAGVFLADVFIRRVQVHFYWVAPALAGAFHRIRGHQVQAAPDERLARLREARARRSKQRSNDGELPRGVRHQLLPGCGPSGPSLGPLGA